MTESVTAPAAIGRLAHQLHTLSQVSESLTYRLLELEERLADLDRLVQPLLTARSAQSAQLSEDAELRLDDTESRLSRLESMLSSLDSTMANAADQPFDGFGDAVAEEEPLFLDDQAAPPEIEIDEVQEFPADDFDDDQRLIA